MTLIKFLILLLMSLMASAATFNEYSSIDTGYGDFQHLNDFKSFGRRLIRRRSTNQQEKRDISLSYAATNINNKEGTQVKTITVIKNLNDKNEKLKIDPKLHKNENWAKAFKDNFDSYGIIPDVPDVDDLFEFVNKKHNGNNNNNGKENEKMVNEDKTEVFVDKKEKENTTMRPNAKAPSKEIEKPVTEISAEISDEVTESMKVVEKIKGDAELLPNFNSSRLKVRESLINLNYSAPGHSVRQYFDNYVQLNSAGNAVAVGYDYPKPCVHGQPVGSVTVATPSGRTYNIPVNNNSYINPYLAPAATRRPPLVQQTSQIPPANSPTFPINSLVPPLQQTNNNNPTLNNFLPQQNPSAVGQQPQQPNNSLQPPTFQNNFQTNIQQLPPQQNPQQQPQQGQNSFSTTSQRPYVSPNIRSGLGGVSRGPGSNVNINFLQNGQPGYRINTFSNTFRKPNVFRSRGLKY